MTILALTKVHQSQVQQLFADVSFFGAEWLLNSQQLFFGFFTQNNDLAAVAHIELYYNAVILKALTTRRAYRGQGMAYKLLKYVEHYAQTMGFDTLYAFTQYGANYLECVEFQQTISIKLPIQIANYLVNHQLYSTIIMKKVLITVKKHPMRQESLQIRVLSSHLVA